MVQTSFTAALLAAAVKMAPQLRGAYRLLLLTAGMLLVVFGLTILVARSLRRYRQTYLSERRKPTPNEDLWSKHRLAKEFQEDEEGDSN